MKTLVVRIPDTLDAELDRSARTRRVAKSVIVRERLTAQHADAGQPSLWSRMKDLVITDDVLPTDLSSNKKHLKGYGKDRASR